MLSPALAAANRHHATRSFCSAAAFIFVLATVLLSTGCAASAALERGRTAERVEDYDRAVVEYANALRLKPNDPDLRLALDRAKLRGAQQHFDRGRRLAAAGKHDQAL